jgi:hypothetical protein
MYNNEQKLQLAIILLFPLAEDLHNQIWKKHQQNFYICLIFYLSLAMKRYYL